MLNWLATRTKPLADRIARKMDYPRLTLWKDFLYSPAKTMEKAAKSGSTTRAILDLGMCSLWYLVGIFWLVALSAKSPLIAGFEGWLASTISKSAFIIGAFFLAVFLHWFITNSLEYFFLTPGKKRLPFRLQAYLSALGFGSMTTILMALQIIAHAVAFVIAVASVIALFAGNVSVSRSMLEWLSGLFLFSSVFFPLLLQVLRIILQEKVLSSNGRLTGAKLAGLVIIEFGSLFSVGYVAALGVLWALGTPAL